MIAQRPSLRPAAVRAQRVSRVRAVQPVASAQKLAVSVAIASGAAALAVAPVSADAARGEFGVSILRPARSVSALQHDACAEQESIGLDLRPLDRAQLGTALSLAAEAWAVARWRRMRSVA